MQVSSSYTVQDLPGTLASADGVQQAGTVQIDPKLLSDAVSAVPGTLVADASGLPRPDDGNVTAADVRNTLLAVSSLSVEESAADATAVAKLMFQMQQEMKTAERRKGFAAASNANDALMSMADKMEQAASDRYAGSVAAAGLAIAGGGLQMGAGVMGGIYGAKGAKNTAASAENAIKAGDFKVETSAHAKWSGVAKIEDSLAQKHGSYSQSALAIGQGGSASLSGSGQMANAQHEYNAGLEDAEKQRLQAYQTVNDAAVETSRKNNEHIDQTTQQICDLLAEKERSHTESVRAMARNV
ncbi:hypothetical protein [Achromobacter marplatensis]|uniref:hypothetical protein n=1 Tax=Achromobacter marplatensis TaxID=470868 RepID=UPI0039F6FF7D